MTILICDICGTSYPDTDEKCPTCGYARAFAEDLEETEQVPVVREKVRGGRYSKKNVRKRMLLRAETAVRAEQSATAPEMAEEITAVLAAADHPGTDVPAVRTEPEEASVMDLPVHQEETADPVIEIPADAWTESAVPAEEMEENIPEAAEPVFEIPEQTWEEPETPVMDMPAAPEEVPEEPLIPLVILPEEAPALEETPETEEPAGEEMPEQEQAEEMSPEEEEAEKKKTVLAAYRRDVALNLTLFFSMVIFVLSSAYLVIQYGLPALRDFEWPAFSLVEPTQAPTQAPTEEPTEAPTEAPTAPPTQPPTDPPTEAPTEPPTEAPTDPPTDPPTEAPTDPPELAVPLTLNYYELTFLGSNQGVQMIVDGYYNSDITWTSDDPSVVTINENGFIISVGPGTTYVTASYGGHSVRCIVYCRF